MRGAWKAAGAVAATALLLVVVYSCSSGTSSADDDTTACVPGQQVNCGCPGGTPGYQVCRTDGSGYSGCRCPDAGGGATGGSGGSGTGAGAASGGGGSQPTGGGGGGPGGSGGTAGAGGSVASCAGDAFPPNLPDLPACSGDGTACDAGGGAAGTCFSSHCFLNCTNSCTQPFECVQIQSATVCSVLTSCGSRCDVAKAVLCLDPATCITISGDTYGMCLPACVASACPYDAGSYAMSCLFQAGSDWFCGFDCTSLSCPAEYDCVTVNQVKRCEPKQS